MKEREVSSERVSEERLLEIIEWAKRYGEDARESCNVHEMWDMASELLALRSSVKTEDADEDVFAALAEEELLSAIEASAAPSEVTEEMVERALTAYVEADSPSIRPHRCTQGRSPMTVLNSEGLEKAVAQAIFDPGATEGYKGDRTLTEWQVQAVMRAITSHTPALPPVDGLEVVGWEHKLTGIIRQRGDRPSLGVADGDYEELCHLSQASSVIAGLRKRVQELEALADQLKLEAQLHADEARGANHTIHAIYQVLSGATGEPGNWNGAEPARRYVAAAEARTSSLEEENKRLREALEPFAKAADIKLCGEWRDDERFGQTDVSFHLTFGHLRAARQALGDHNG